MTLQTVVAKVLRDFPSGFKIFQETGNG